MVARKTSVTIVCTLCGAVFESNAKKLPVKCPDCKKKLDREHKAAYAQRRRANPELNAAYNERRREARRKNAKIKEKEHARYVNRKQTDGFIEDMRQRSKSYYDTNKDAVCRKAKERYEKLKVQKKSEATTDCVRGKANELEALSGLLRECHRMHVRALHLPCGERHECFGAQRCPECPPDATPPVCTPF